MGEIVESWTEFGHTFEIEKLAQPVRRGVTLRHYRLWENGQPALGGQWHCSIESARTRAKYVTRSSYISRVEFLELCLNKLQTQLYETRKENELLKERLQDVDH